MKKNAMLKIAAILMVAVLLTTCAISSTFAKYTTSKTSAAEGARVAKFGVVLTTTLDGLFLEAYDVDSNTEDNKADQSVVSVSGNVVAPGTANSIEITGTVAGTPEVAVALTTSAVLTLEGWTAKAGGEYCPLVFTVDGVDYYIGKDASITSVATLITAVQNAIAAAGTTTYAPNTDLSAQDATNFDIGWRWEFEKGSSSTVALQNNTDDTFLGDEAAANRAATISLTITQTVDQLDVYEVTETTAESSDENA
jgi:hypothetical protein